MTLQGLVPLAQHCPLLRHLMLSIDTQTIPHIHSHRNVINNCLQTLGVLNHYSQTNNPRKVADFLARIFPNVAVDGRLSHDEYYDESDPVHEDEYWRKVGSLISASRRLRESVGR